MTEVTLETFKKAAEKAGKRLRGETDETPPVDASDADLIRERIREIIAEGEVEDSVRRISRKTADRIQDMLWPERDIEVKKRKVEVGVEQQAFNEYIREILQESQ